MAFASPLISISHPLVGYETNCIDISSLSSFSSSESKIKDNPSHMVDHRSVGTICSFEVVSHRSKTSLGGEKCVDKDLNHVHSYGNRFDILSIIEPTPHLGTRFFDDTILSEKVGGDFNIIIKISKKAKEPSNAWAICDFNYFIQGNVLLDVGFSSNSFIR
ncbi:unnamed protein product [Dovyalis caffra]|uniref:Uncharacterized protein n=1 Tax=Dovyalis caffra TaxID=77055 RepID=A0AAV1QZ77_9ROSI|nr:unnamed protein product [Dovyalis caffra]